MTNRTQVARPADPVPAAGTAVANKPRAGLYRRMSLKYGVEQEKMLDTLKATAFRQRGKDGKEPPVITNEQMTALLLVAEKYDLDPFVKQLYAFPNQAGGIEPIVPIDGWLSIINNHPQFADMELAYGPAEPGEPPSWIECVITRKDRTKPTVIREYMAECYRDTVPWKSHPARMLRHKAIIQCGRVAFGLSGIYDPDEAERIANANAIDAEVVTGKPETKAPKALSDGPARIDGSQAALLTEKLQTNKLTAAGLCEYFGIESLGQLKADQVNAALDWINANGA